jgi:hypothetical protein
MEEERSVPDVEEEGRGRGLALIVLGHFALVEIDHIANLLLETKG